MKSKFSRRGIIGIVVAAIVLIGIIVAVIWYNAPTQKVSRLIKLGQQYLEAEQYEQAVAVYRDILTIDPKNDSASNGAITAYSLWGNELLENGNFEDAVRVLDEARTILDNDKALISAETEVYLAWSESKAEAGEIEKAIDILREGYDKLNDDRLKEALDALTNGDSEVSGLDEGESVDAELKDFAEAISASCATGDYDKLFSIFSEYGGDYEDISSSLLHGKYHSKLPMIIQTSVNTVGIYDNNKIYCGEYDGNERSGEGVWLVITDSSQFYSIGEWKNDAPNGHQSTKHYSDGGGAMLQMWSGNVVNGLWDGKVHQTRDDAGYVMESDYNIVAGQSATISNQVWTFYKDEQYANSWWDMVGLPGYADGYMIQQ